ncbi:CbbX protein [Amycolatopsis rubida]|uniref:CbbX protein n=1 Tax=Amycolatopsis rubida TaxID=112413 RepID=A0ABX0C1Q6_9PSEU|nr:MULTISPECIES: CbbX protein [Amycolatopsis]MYW93987.1 CbbX protein [Amycolatopsis rubida]NEC58976.1 CbbX protein [Amycolatopsis rubida]OAP26351.1 Stage V sporulation protein K [Amycolatopsis sp. M39]
MSEPGRSGFVMHRPGSPAATAQDEPPPAEDAELPGDAVVDLAEVRSRAGVGEVLAELDRDLVGLAPVKRRVEEIAALLLVDRTRERFGIRAARPNLHMSFTGNPGTGKTTVALRMAELLKRLGYLRRGHLVAVTRDDLVGQYVGHTAPKTAEVVKRAMGGVLFVDEAYYLYRAENERDYGQEAIEILLQVMENNRDDLVVVFAGYADRMDDFFASNPGLSSRVAHHLAFPDYTVAELERIGQLMVSALGYELSGAARAVFREYLELRVRRPRFANARSVRNAVERARLRQANRLVREGAADRARLVRIEPEDFLASTVFADRMSTVEGTG